MKSLYFSILFFLQFSPFAFNQIRNNKAPEANLAIVGRAYQDSIVLRMFASKPPVWEMALKNGFAIDRAELSSTNTSLERLNYSPLAGSPFMPWSQDRWAEWFTKNEDKEESEIYEMMAITYGMLEADFTESNPDEFKDVFADGLNSLQANKNKLDMKFTFAMMATSRNALAAEALGSKCVDVNVEMGKTYVYRVTLNGESPVYSVVPGYLKIKAEKYDDSVLKQKVSPEEGDQKIMLAWDKKPEYFGYWVERSDDGGINYQRLTDAPIVKSAHGESSEQEMVNHLDEKGLENYKTYYYRIYGCTVFGDCPLIGEAKATPKDLTPPGRPFLGQLKHNTATKTVEIEWTMNEPVNSDLAGFMIGRSHEHDGPFSLIHDGIIPPETRTFKDKTFDIEKSNFYLIEAIDTAGNVSRSQVAYLTVIDDVPPIKPEFESGIMDTNGVVTLIFKPNPEKDLMGYRIFKSNALSHEFSVAWETYAHDSDSLAKSTIFKDTVAMNTLTKAVYYKVAALDYHYNQSEPSEPIKVARPDIIPPVSPIIVDYLVTDKYVSIKFVESASDDVQQYVIYRKNEGSDNWEVLDELLVDNSNSENTLSYVDSNVVSNRVYEYAVQAIDESGLKSEISISVIARPYRSFSIPPPIMSASYDKETKRIRLSWETEFAPANEFFFILYRSLNDDGFLSIKKIDGKSEYTHEELVGVTTKSCSFKLKTVTANGESLPSEPVIVFVPQD